MIKVIYSGRLGNQLFQYTAGKIAAYLRNDNISALPIPGFRLKIDKPFDKTDDTSDAFVIGGNKISQNQIKQANSNDIVIKGLFQDYASLQPYKTLIRKAWIVPETRAAEMPSKSSVVIHARRGDYVRLGWATTFSFYEKALEVLLYDKVFIVTDRPSDPFFARFAKYNATILKASALDSFWFLLNANKLVIAQSTFSWWAAFLSSAESIIVPTKQNGPWSAPGINLRVDDEERFRYITDSEEEAMTKRERAFLGFEYCRHYFHRGTITRAILRHSPIEVRNQLAKYFPSLEESSLRSFS